MRGGWSVNAGEGGVRERVGPTIDNGKGAPILIPQKPPTDENEGSPDPVRPAYRATVQVSVLIIDTFAQFV